MGVGGIPRGRITEISGRNPPVRPPSPSTASLQAQKKGGVCAYVDVEHAIDPEFAKKLGVDVDNLYVSQPTTGEEALDIMDAPRSAVQRNRHRAVLELGRRAGAEGGVGGRYGQLAHGRPCAADVAGPPQSRREHQPHQHFRHLHQPDPPEDRRDVRQPGDHSREDWR